MPHRIGQLIPQAVCLACDVCCRYPERTTVLAPYIFSEEALASAKISGTLHRVGKKADPKTPPVPYRDFFACSHFAAAPGRCSVYGTRPLDCRLYPFMVTYASDRRSVVLTLDASCPYLKDALDTPSVKQYIGRLSRLLGSERLVEELNANKGFINEYQPGSVVVRHLGAITKRLDLSGYGLAKLSVNDKDLFDGYFPLADQEISVFSFAGIFIWSSVLHILWKKIGRSMCVFAGNDKDYFLLIPPLGLRFDAVAAREAFDILSSMNGPHSSAPRIENLPHAFVDDALRSGFSVDRVTEEYVYRQNDLSRLCGNRYKSKRSPIRTFEKRHAHRYRDMTTRDIFSCLDLYREWALARLERIKDTYFRFLIEDSYFAQKTALMNLAPLGLTGKVVEVDGVIKGYSIGYPLNDETFVVLFETTDLAMKGLAQYIFREFSRQLSSYRFINALGDSGLENIRTVKESYRPVKKIGVYTARVSRIS